MGIRKKGSDPISKFGKAFGSIITDVAPTILNTLVPGTGGLLSGAITSAKATSQPPVQMSDKTRPTPGIMSTPTGYRNGGPMDSKDLNRFIKSSIAANKGKNFVDRIVDPYAPSTNVMGVPATHYMSSAEVDGRNIVYPNVVQRGSGNQLQHLSPEEAIDYALKTGEFMEFGTPEEANNFATNYKQEMTRKFKHGGMLKAYNAPTHENGGQMIDANANPTNNPNKAVGEIEKKETSWNGYVFSDTLGEGKKTFAQMSKEIVNRYKGKRDNLSKKTMEKELSLLVQKNEAARLEKEQMEMQQQQNQFTEEELATLQNPQSPSKEQLDMLFAQQQQQQQGQPSQEQMMQMMQQQQMQQQGQPSEEEMMMMQQMQQQGAPQDMGQYRWGGNMDVPMYRYQDGGGLNDIDSKMMGQQQIVTNTALPKDSIPTNVYQQAVKGFFEAVAPQKQRANYNYYEQQNQFAQPFPYANYPFQNVANIPQEMNMQQETMKQPNTPKMPKQPKGISTLNLQNANQEFDSKGGIVYQNGGMLEVPEAPLDEYKKGGWIQKATKSIKKRGTEGVCTGDKFGGPSCPPGSKRYNLAKTFKAMAKKEDGGYIDSFPDLNLANYREGGTIQKYPNGGMMAPEWMESAQWPYRIKEKDKRDDVIKNFYYGIIDDLQNPQAARQTLKNINQYYGTDRLEGLGEEIGPYFGFDYNDINDKDLDKWTNEYMEQRGFNKKPTSGEYKDGGMIKRADGSYSQRGLWDNIRDNIGSGKKPTKEMLEQEAKIKAKEYGDGGYVVTRSNDRKGKTHKVTGPDGSVKYFGDPDLKNNPSEKAKDAFYARHKKNLEGNPHFRAYARATWRDGGMIPEYPDGGGLEPFVPYPGYGNTVISPGTGLELYNPETINFNLPSAPLNQRSIFNLPQEEQYSENVPAVPLRYQQRMPVRVPERSFTPMTPVSQPAPPPPNPMQQMLGNVIKSAAETVGRVNRSQLNPENVEYLRRNMPIPSRLNRLPKGVLGLESLDIKPSAQFSFPDLIGQNIMNEYLQKNLPGSNIQNEQSYKPLETAFGAINPYTAAPIVSELPKNPWQQYLEEDVVNPNEPNPYATLSVPLQNIPENYISTERIPTPYEQPDPFQQQMIAGPQAAQGNATIPYAPEYTPETPGPKDKPSPTTPKEDPFKLRPLEYATIGLKGAALGKSIYDALQPAEKEQLRLNREAGLVNNMMAGRNVNMAAALNEALYNRNAALASNQARSANVQRALDMQTYSNSERNAIRSKLEEQNMNNQLRMQEAQVRAELGAAEAAERVRRQNVQSMNEAARRQFGQKAFQDLSTIGTELNKVQVYKDMYKNMKNMSYNKFREYVTALNEAGAGKFKLKTPTEQDFNAMQMGNFDFDQILEFMKS